jgi:hypothetical protein
MCHAMRDLSRPVFSVEKLWPYIALARITLVRFDYSYGITLYCLSRVCNSDPDAHMRCIRFSL